LTSIAQVFQFETDTIRTAVVDGKEWVVAKDVCASVGISKYRDAVAQLDDDERVSATVDTLGGPQQMTLVNESGVYALLLISRSPKTKAFRKWVTATVLPSIRETGRYEIATQAVVPAQRRDFPVPTTLTEALRFAADEIEKRERVIAELAPKAEQADHYRRAEGITAIGDFANDLAQWARDNHGTTIKHADVRAYLAELGLLIRGNTIRNNEPTADAQKRGLMRIKHNVFDTNHHGTQSRASARLTEKGVALVWDRATQRIAATGSLKPSTAIERTAS
jgi:prophage antirepressor-like protein